MPDSLLEPGRNCWRIERAERAALVVDADAYFAAAREAMLEAKRRIMLIGWDFDARIRIGDADGDGAPATIGDLILWLVKRRPELEIYLLRWDVGAIKSLFRGSTPLTLIRWWKHGRIHVKLDAMHPPGASHHQKIVVVDDCLAFCGGIDMTDMRWDTRAHDDEDPRRVGPSGAYGPWHDATMALDGKAAAALGDLARARWRSAGGEALEPVAVRDECWPDSLEPHFVGAVAALSRTCPDYKELDECLEIERLSLDLIASARRFIYAESQYFASRRIAEAVAKRVAEPDGPEIVLINPQQAEGWLEREAMDTARARLWQAVGKCDERRRFRLYHPFTAAGTPVYCHAKIMIVDDSVLRVGSSNWNNRSLRLDTECDVTIDSALPGNAAAAAAIRTLREGLMAEHLGVEPVAIERAFDETGSLIETVERLRGGGRTLKPYELPDLNALEEKIADNELLDPEGPDAMFEPIARRSLFARLPFPGRRR